MDKKTKQILKNIAQDLNNASSLKTLNEDITKTAFFAYFELVRALLKQNDVIEENEEEIIKMIRLNAMYLFDDILMTSKLKLLANGKYDLSRHR